MRIYIPTYGRSDKQVTRDSLPERIRNEVVLVVQDREKDQYRDAPVLVLPPHITTIGPTRQWLMETVQDRVVCMMDDDLTFATRRADNPSRFYESSEEDMLRMIFTLWELAVATGMAGISPREGANREIEKLRWNTRQIRVHAILRGLYLRNGYRFDRVPLMEDFDVVLQHLRKGERNVVLNQWVHNQGGSNTSGGCSHYRTPELQEQAAHALRELHPDFVTVVTKETKTSWGGKVRSDVRIAWKKAAHAGALHSRE